MVIYQPPDPVIDVKKDIYRTIRTGDVIKTNWSGNSVQSQKINAELDKLLPNNPNLIKVKPDELICINQNECLTIIENYDGLYNLGNHFSYFGAKLIVDNIALKNDMK